MCSGLMPHAGGIQVRTQPRRNDGLLEVHLRTSLESGRSHLESRTLALCPSLLPSGGQARGKSQGWQLRLRRGVCLSAAFESWRYRLENPLLRRAAGAQTCPDRPTGALCLATDQGEGWEPSEAEWRSSSVLHAEDWDNRGAAEEPCS